MTALPVDNLGLDIDSRIPSLSHSGAPHFRHLLCVGDAQSANRGSERFEGDRYLRL